MGISLSKSFISIGVIILVTLFIFLSTSSATEKLAFGLWNLTREEKLATLVDSDNPYLSFAIAEYYFNHGSYDIKKAEQYYTRAIKQEPSYLEAYYQRGRIHFINGRFIAALADIKMVLGLNPEFKKAYYMYGLVNGYAGNLEQAEYGFKEFIKRDEFNWAGHNDLAWVYFKQGDYEKTKLAAEAGLVHAPTNVWLNNIYGTALMNLGEKEQAKAAFEKALEKSKEMTGADWGIAYPGNDPALYETGIEETRSVIKHNLTLLEEN